MLYKLKGLFSIGKENEVHVVVVLDLHTIYAVIDTYLLGPIKTTQLA
jgi:hypothetical protein